MSCGWAGKILRVDLTNRESSVEPVEPYTRSFIGGRGISVKKIYDEVDPQLSPYDPGNKLCFGPGVLTGTPAAASGRLKVTGMAAGGLLRHAGLGGQAPAEIKWAGYDLIIIQGKADKPVYIRIHDDSVEIKDAGHIWGKDVYETQEILKDGLGDSFEVICIGPGGENALSFASIHTGWGSAAGRCGFGGVMGSKNLKAIAVRGTRGLKIAKTEEFLEVAEEQRRSFAANELVIDEIKAGGDKWVAWSGEHGGIMARGNFEACDWGTLHFPKLDDFASKYRVGPHGCPSCPISHFEVYDVPGIGRGAAKCVGVQSIATLWTNDENLWFHAYNLMNRYGMDVCSTANIIAFLMELHEKGIIMAEDTDGIPMIKGDRNAIISAIHMLAKQEGFGKLFKDGVVQGAKKLGRGAEDYAMATKELELQPYELRAFKQAALATVTNTKDCIDAFGVLPYVWAAAKDDASRHYWEKQAEELYGTSEAAIPNSYLGAATATVAEEGRHAAADIVGVCHILIPRFMAPHFDIQARLLSLATGMEITEDELLFVAQREVTLERAFNVMRGVRRKDDTLPKRFFEEPVPGGPYKGERLLKAEFDKALDEYYALRGYDKDGIPKKEAFKKYGLLSEWEAFKKKVPGRGNEAR